MKRISILLFVLVFYAEGVLVAQEISKMKLFLLIGQSNMAGRGNLEMQDTVFYPRVLALSKDLKWLPARDPIHFDKKEAGVGLGRTFGIEMQKYYHRMDTLDCYSVGLIPCAVGGTDIDKWQPGAYDSITKTHPWDDMVKRATFAMQNGEIEGILWLQGEGDSNLDKSKLYEDKLLNLITRVRLVAGNKSTPFICGELGRFFVKKQQKDGNSGAAQVIKTTKKIMRKGTNTAFVSSKGLTDRGDKLHFDAKSCRELGKRFAQTYQKLFGL
jgi:Carbohydrate esterase, sialic acid-specific acetylesterase